MRGRAIALSRPRRLMCDLMHFAKQIPSVPVQRRMNLSAVVAARSACPDRPAWPAIFAKAFALVARDIPQLRRAYVKFPWPHLYEYEASVALVAVEREYDGEPALFGYRLKSPIAQSLTQLTETIRHATTAPLAEVEQFAQALRFAQLPRLLRRALWWLGLNIGKARAKQFGTFGVSAYGGLGAESLHPITVLTALVNYGVIAADGSVDVRIVYDHRAMDGSTVAHALAALEECLNGAIARELHDVNCATRAA